MENNCCVESKQITQEEFEKQNKIRFDRFLRTIFYICDQAGFRIEGRVTFVDKKTGKVYD